MNKILAVDVDLTVVDTLTPWLSWFKDRTGLDVKNEDGNYDLVPEMKQLIAQSGTKEFSPFEFWKKPDLYDNLEPLPGAARYLNEAAKADGYDVVFVSSCVPEHVDSKERFLKKHFNFAGFVNTHDKHFVNYETLVDDKLFHLKMGKRYRKDSHHILFTGVRKDGRPGEETPYLQMKSWT